MNCQEFNDRLFEYVDGTLEARLQSDAQEHLRQCAACRQALQREEAIARSLHLALHRAAAPVALDPAAKRAILRAAEHGSAAETVGARVWQWLSAAPLRPLAASAAILGILLLVAVGLHRREAPEAAPAGRPEPTAWAIDVPIQTQARVFQEEDGTVVDAIVPAVAVARADLHLSSRHPSASP